MKANSAIVSGVAGRYATALYELADERSVLETAESDLDKLAAAISENADLRTVIESPLISKEDQQAAIFAILDKLGVVEVTRNFVGVIIRNGRLREMPQMINAFKKLLAAARGEVTAEVAAPKPLSDKQLKSVSTVLSKFAGKDVKLESRVDEALLGGLVVKYGSKMIDNSLKTKLDNLRLSMKEVG